MSHPIKKSYGVLSSDMMKKFLKVSAIIGAIVVFLSLAAVGFYHLQYQEYMRQKRATFFVNIDVTSLGTIERMEYSICGEKTPVEPYYEDQDGRIFWGEKIATPRQLRSAEGIPCPVEILLVKDGKTWRYPADHLFDCPDCDGIHNYTVLGDKAVYRYSP